MALRGNTARIFLDGVDLSATTSELSIETTTGEYDVTNLASTLSEFRPGLNEGRININGYFHGVMSGQEEAALYAALGASNKIVAAVFDYTSLPAPAYVIENGSNLELSWSAPTDGIFTIFFGFRGQLGVKRGLLLTYKSNKTATGLGTAVQIPGVTTGSVGRIFSFVHGITGTQSGDITLAVQSSATGTSGWTNEATFTFPSGAGAQAAALTTPVGPYFNINVTAMGGVTSFTTSLIITIQGLTT